MAVETADAKRTWKQTIWWLRKLHRWSQDRLAEELRAKSRIANYGLPAKREHIKRTVQHWEAGDSLPSDEYSVLLVLVFALDEELSGGTLAPGSYLDRLMTAYEAMGYEMDRRRFFLSAAALAIAGRDTFATWNMEAAERLDYVLRHPRSVDLATVGYLREQVSRLDEQYDRTPSTSLLPAAGQWHGQVTYLREHAPGGVLRELHAVEAQSATLMGQLVWDASQRRDHTTARTYYDQAISAAAEIKDAAAEAYARLRMSYVALYGERDPHTGLSSAQEATALADGGASSALAGLALLHVGEAHAMLGNRERCEGALSQAETHFARVGEGDAVASVASPEQLGRLAGSCYLFLQEPGRAQPILERTANALRGKEKSKAIVLGNLSL